MSHEAVHEVAVVADPPILQPPGLQLEPGGGALGDQTATRLTSSRAHCQGAGRRVGDPAGG